MSFFRENDWRDDLSEQIGALRSEVSSLRREASRQSGRALDSTRHTGEDIYHTIRNYFSPRPSFYQRGWHKAADNPGATAAAALVGVAVIGLAATFFFRDSFQRDRSEEEKPEYPGTPTPPPSA